MNSTPTISRARSRSKPRLAKTRKPSGKSKTVSNGVDSGFNPFGSVSKGNYDSSRFNSMFDDTKFRKFQNLGFVSGVNLDDEREIGESVDVRGSFRNGKVKTEEENGKFENLGFVSGSSKSYLGLKSKNNSGLVGKLGGDYSGKLNLNIGLESGTSYIDPNHQSPGVNLCSDDNVFSKWDVGSNGKDKANIQNKVHVNNDFVCGVNINKLSSIFSFEKTDIGESVDETVQKEVGVEAEVKKHEHASLVFGLHTTLMPCTNGERLKADAETKFEKVNGVFVFGKCSYQSSAFDEGIVNNPSSKTEKKIPITEMFLNCNDTGINKNGGLGPDPVMVNTEISYTTNEKSESVAGGSTDVPTTSDTVPIHILPDVSKLNINDYEKTNGMENSRFSTRRFVTNSEIDKSNLGGPEKGEAVENINDLCRQSNGYVFEAFPMDRSEHNESILSGISDRLDTTFREFSTPKWDPSSFKKNLFSELNTKFELSAKSKSVKSNRLKKSGRKLRQPNPTRLSTENKFELNESTFRENSSSPGSPMDFSPYQETVAADLSTQDTNQCDLERQKSNSEVQFSFSPGFQDIGGSFTFSSSPSANGSLSARKGHYRKKDRFKVDQDSFTILPRSNEETAPPSFDFSLSSNSYLHLDAMHGEKENLISSQPRDEEADEKQVKPASAELREACKKWQNRGNEAYEKKDLTQAEEFYTRGIRSVPRRERSGCCLEPLVKCYGNRAATRMSLGRIREALRDCLRAAALDPNFLKIQMRAANCHLLLGEVEDAIQYFKNCLKSGTGVCLDRRFVIEASDGLQKAQKVAACTKQCAELLQQRASNDASSALTLINDALSISPYSEKLLEMKAEALCMLRKYEEVIKLCEQTQLFAEKMHSSSGGDNESASGKSHENKNNSFVKLWRQRLIAKSYFHLGRLQAALDLLEKQEHLSATLDKCKGESPEASILLAVTIRELLHRKSAGNEAFQSGRHTEALEHYTTALSTNVQSRPFTAVCFCNRAAAHQALGQIGEAIADCSLAIALDENYLKAVSRRATLHEQIRDYAQAANDLQRYTSIIEKQSHRNDNQTAESRQANIKELRQAQRRLSSMEELTKKGIPSDLYLILGIKSSDTTVEIKKAYRKAALRHHPDKAGQFLARSESGEDGGIWKEIITEVHKDAERLFKMIGEAYAVLSDPEKRSEYDLGEERRNAPKESTRTSSLYRRQSDAPQAYRSSQNYWEYSF